jgi:hypothetical protein
VINANTKTATKVLMLSVVAVEYGGIGQIRRRKNGSFISEYPADVRCGLAVFFTEAASTKIHTPAHIFGLL